MQSLGLGTPGQNEGQQSQNMTNAINQAFANNQSATNSSLAFLSQLLNANPAPAQRWPGIGSGPQFGNGVTLGGGGTNNLGALIQPPAVAPSAPTIAPGLIPPPASPAARTTQQQPTAGPGSAGPLGGQQAAQTNQGMPVFTPPAGQTNLMPGPNPSYQIGPDGTVYFNGNSGVPSQAVAGKDLTGDETAWLQKWGAK